LWRPLGRGDRVGARCHPSNAAARLGKSENAARAGTRRMTETRKPPFVSRERWKVLEPLLDAALALSGDARARLLDEACGFDVTMRSELAGMIDACERPERPGHVLDRPAAERFASLWEENEMSGFRAELADRYRLDGEVGRGGMAVVYRARDFRHQRPV